MGYEAKLYSREDAEDIIEFAKRAIAFVEELANKFERKGA